MFEGISLIMFILDFLGVLDVSDTYIYRMAHFLPLINLSCGGVKVTLHC